MKTDNDIVERFIYKHARIVCCLLLTYYTCSMVLPHSDSANILEPDIPGLWNPAKKQDKKTNSGVVKMSKMEHVMR